MFAENSQSLKTLVMTLLEPDQPLITGPRNILGVDLRLLGLDCIKGVDVLFGREFLGKQIRIQ